MIGRVAETEELEFLLDVERVVAIVGAPGIGKSALARSTGPQIWVELEAARTLQEAKEALAAALGCPNPQDTSLRFALETVDTVVLDGADGALDFLDDLIGLGAQVSWLVTSRRHVASAGSQVELGPLSNEHGAQLLRRSVKNARRREELDEDALRALSEALDGIPLALELAAPRLRMFSPEDLVQKAPSLHQLGVAIQSLVDALPEATRGVIEVAAQLPGTFTVHTLDLATGIDSEAHLLTLIQSALVHSQPGSPPRFRVLGPLRAAIRPEPGLSAEVAERLAEPILTEAEKALNAGTAAGLSTVEGLRPLLEALIGTDADISWRAGWVLCRLYRLLADFDAVVALYERLPADGPIAHRVNVATLVTDALRFQGRAGEGFGVLDALEGSITPETEAPYRVARAIVGAVTGDLQAAHDDCVALFDEHTPPHLWRRLGALRFHLSDSDGAMEALRKALPTSDPQERFQAIATLATTMMEGQHPEAEILALLDQVDLNATPASRGFILSTRGFLAAREGHIDAAMETLFSAYEASRRVGYLDGGAIRWLWSRCIGLADGRIPTELLDNSQLVPPLNDPTRPLDSISCMSLHRIWCAVIHATLGHREAAKALAPKGIEVQRSFSRRNADEMSSILAVAMQPLDPDYAATLLEPLESCHIVDVARRICAGEPLPPPRSLEERVLFGIHGLQAQRIQVSRDGSRFRSGTGELVDISRRKVLAKVLASLAQADEPLDVNGICAAVWPNERMVGNSGTRRVHVAISTLRGLGLRPVLLTVEEGDATCWKLDADVLDAG